MSDSEHDDEFEAYLKRRVPIDEGLRSSEQLEPPPELDRIVIGNARRAIQGATPVHLYRAPKWALPVALAATILVSFAILLDLGVRTRRSELLASAPTAPVTGAVAGRASAPAPVPAIATGPWPPPAAPAAPSPASPSEAELHRDAIQEGVIEPARTRVARVEAAASRERARLDAQAAPADAQAQAAAKPRQSARWESTQPVRQAGEVVTGSRRTAADNSTPVAGLAAPAAIAAPLEPMSPPPGAPTYMDPSPAIESVAASARAAIEKAEREINRNSR